MAKERRLGRGLEALLGRIPDPSVTDASDPPAGADPNPPVAGGNSSIGQEVTKPPETISIRAPSTEGVDLTRPNTSPKTVPNVAELPQPRTASHPVGGTVSTTAMGNGASRDTSTAPDVGTASRPKDNLPPSALASGGHIAQGAAEATVPGRLTSVEISQIESNPFQPRKEFPAAEIQSLADSLRAHGLLQPVVVRRHGDKYQLVAGERRLRAAVQAGWTHVPAQVIEADDRQLAELALVENLHRKDLNPLEKAASFQRYLREFGGTQEQLASRLKMDRSTIANLIRLLELPAAVQQALRDGRITQGHARALLSLEDERTQIAFCERIQREGWSVRQTEAMVKKALEEASLAEADHLRVVAAEAPPKPPRSQNHHLAALEREFRLALGTNVQIISNGRGRGRVVIHFRTHEEFERIRRTICDASPLPHAKAS